jgi:CheY-like chemotaxis protein
MTCRPKLAFSSHSDIVFKSLLETAAVLLHVCGSDGEDEKPAMPETRRGILLIDDEIIVLKSAKRLLEKKGYSVLTAEDGFAGMGILREHTQEIGVILLDLSMPGMEGEEALENILAIDPDAKVVLFSGYSRTMELDPLFQKGAVGHIQKPFDVKDLIALIEQWLGPKPPQN